MPSLKLLDNFKGSEFNCSPGLDNWDKKKILKQVAEGLEEWNLKHPARIDPPNVWGAHFDEVKITSGVVYDRKVIRGYVSKTPKLQLADCFAGCLRKGPSNLAIYACQVHIRHSVIEYFSNTRLSLSPPSSLAYPLAFFFGLLL